MVNNRYCLRKCSETAILTMHESIISTGLLSKTKQKVKCLAQESLKSDSHLLKKFFIFASMIAL